MLQNGIKILEISSGKEKKILPKFTTATRFFPYEALPQEHLTDTRLVLLESRRGALPSRYYDSEASKPPVSAKTKQRLWVTMECSCWVRTSCICNDWTLLAPVEQNVFDHYSACA